MTNQITVTITRTFTPTDGEAGDLNNAATELRYDTLYVEQDEQRLRSVDALLDDAEWVISEKVKDQP